MNGTFDLLLGTEHLEDTIPENPDFDADYHIEDDDNEMIHHRSKRTTYVPNPDFEEYDPVSS